MGLAKSIASPCHCGRQPQGGGDSGHLASNQSTLRAKRASPNAAARISGDLSQYARSDAPDSCVSPFRTDHCAEVAGRRNRDEGLDLEWLILDVAETEKRSVQQRMVQSLQMVSERSESED